MAGGSAGGDERPDWTLGACWLAVVPGSSAGVSRVAPGWGSVKTAMTQTLIRASAAMASGPSRIRRALVCRGVP